jgi:hypothetical protein
MCLSKVEYINVCMYVCVMYDDVREHIIFGAKLPVFVVVVVVIVLWNCGLNSGIRACKAGTLLL